MLVTMYKAKEQPCNSNIVSNLTMYTVYTDLAENVNNPIVFDTKDFVCFKNLCEDGFPFMDYVIGHLAYDFTHITEEQKNIGLEIMKNNTEDASPSVFASVLGKKGLCCFFYEDAQGKFDDPEYIWM